MRTDFEQKIAPAGPSSVSFPFATFCATNFKTPPSRYDDRIEAKQRKATRSEAKREEVNQIEADPEAKQSEAERIHKQSKAKQQEQKEEKIRDTKRSEE